MATKQGKNRKQGLGSSKLLFAGGIVVLVVVIVSFVGGPIIGSQFARVRVTFGRYRGREIIYVPGNWFARTVESLGAQSQQVGHNAAIAGLQLRAVWHSAFQDTLLHTAILVDSEEGGSDVSTARIDSEIAQLPQFQRNNRFDVQLYRRISPQDRASMRQLLEESLIHQQYLDDRLYGVSHSEAELDFIRSLGEVERQVRFVAFPFPDYPDEEVGAYVVEQREQFRRIGVSVISVEDRQSVAEDIRRQLVDQVATFEALAREHSDDGFAEQGGERGLVYRYELSPGYEEGQFPDQLFDLEVGGISEVFETRNGWAFYRIDEAVVEPDPEDEELLSVARSYMEGFERGRIEDWFVERAEALRGEADGEASLTEVAGRNDLKVHTTNFFPINYGESEILGSVSSDSSDALDGASYREGFFTVVFGLEPGEVSEPFVLRDTVLLFELIEERRKNDDDDDFAATYYPVMIEDFQTAEIENSLLRRDLIYDDFDRAFSTYVLPPSDTTDSS